MRHSISLVALALSASLTSAFGCEKSSGSTDGFDSPHAALQCQLQAVRDRSMDALAGCFHPDLRAELRAAVAKHGPDWDAKSEAISALAEVTPEDFEIEPVPAAHRELGDQAATVRLERDEFAAVRHEGRWFVVDTGM